MQWATCLSLQWYDSNGLSYHSERQIHEAAACIHGPSIGLILLWADGSPSPYSMEAVIKTSVMDNSSYQKLHQKHVEGADCTPAGFRKWVLTRVCTILISNQPFPILQKASKIRKGRLRLVRMDLCKTKIDLILNSMTFFPQCNRFFFRNYSNINLQRGKTLNILKLSQYYLSSRKVIKSALLLLPNPQCVMLTVKSSSRDTGSWEAPATTIELENLKQEIKLKSAVTPV